jgi:taurine dioxygenase
MGEYATIEVRPLSSALGAEIEGVDLARGPSETQLAEIRRAFGRHGAIFFRDQDLTPEQHLAFAERWGPVNVNRFFKPVEGWPMIAEIRKEPGQQANIGGSWHTDHSYDEVPALGSTPARSPRSAATRCSPACMPPTRRSPRGSNEPWTA